MRVLVTGGAGFIGSALVRHLRAQGDRVRVFDNFSSGKYQHLAGLAGVEVCQGDLREPERVQAAVGGVDCVFHLAAVASVPRSFADPFECEAVNAAGTLAVLEAARQAGVRRVVYSASAAVYGNAAALPLREDAPPDPQSPYGIAKFSGELYGRVYHRVHGLETVALRYFNVYGPRQDPASPYSGVLSRWMDALLEGRRPVLYGDGSQTRDFIHVDDVARANRLAATQPAVRVAGRVFNIATGTSCSLRAVLALLTELSGATVTPCVEAARVGDISHSAADCGWAREQLGFVAQVALRDGLMQTLHAWPRAA